MMGGEGSAEMVGFRTDLGLADYEAPATHVQAAVFWAVTGYMYEAVHFPSAAHVFLPLCGSPLNKTGFYVYFLYLCMVCMAKNYFEI
jgi:hypothetical protein